MSLPTTLSLGVFGCSTASVTATTGPPIFKEVWPWRRLCWKEEANPCGKLQRQNCCSSLLGVMLPMHCPHAVRKEHEGEGSSPTVCVLPCCRGLLWLVLYCSYLSWLVLLHQYVFVWKTVNFSFKRFWVLKIIPYFKVFCLLEQLHFLTYIFCSLKVSYLQTICPWNDSGCWSSWSLYKSS